MAKAELIGEKQFLKKLDAIASQGKKSIARAAMSGAVGPAKKAIRRGINGASLSGPVKRAARLTIGSSVKRQKGGEYGAKVGLSVGKPTKAKRTKAHERSAYGQGGAKLAGGVGLSAANIHWFILGTDERTTGYSTHSIRRGGMTVGKRIKETGGRKKRTGRIKPELAGIVPSAIASSKGEMLSEAARRAAVALKKEAQKRR